MHRVGAVLSHEQPSVVFLCDATGLLCLLSFSHVVDHHMILSLVFTVCCSFTCVLHPMMRRALCIMAPQASLTMQRREPGYGG